MSSKNLTTRRVLRAESGLAGYAPDTGEVYAVLIKRQPKPFSDKRTAAQECRQIALFLTDPDFTLKDLSAGMHCAPPGIPKIFAHYGACPKTRRLLNPPSK
ncbi:MAG: hypothetical protein MSG64_06545 [Pyrinomonadaceae bacterium MAG19_C2-C3]|nr:hypothetical protein [Pyrinomonadaceae bacterium MAG19_C2-C3]